jgi:hypothetical protein
LPLTSAVMELLTDCLFADSFTIPSPQMNISKNNVQLGRIWAAGVGTPSNFQIQQTKLSWQFDLHRAEVLRAILAASVEPMYKPPAEYTSDHNTFLAALVSSGNPLAPTLLYSLINIILTYHADIYVLPYSYSLYTDNREPLVSLAVQLLLLTLDYRSLDHLTAWQSEITQATVELNDEKKQSESNDEQRQNKLDQAINTSNANNNQTFPPAQSSRVLDNTFYNMLCNLSNASDLTILYRGICRLLLCNMQASASYLPNSAKSIEFHTELLVLIWKLLDENPHFLQHILTHCDVLELISVILYYCYEARHNAAKLGLMYSCVFIMLKLSGSRDFAVSLNKTVPTANLAHIPLLSLLDLSNFSGTYADILIIVGHKLIVSSPTHLDALLKVLLTTLANISPYVTRLSMQSSVILLKQFELFTSPKFLYSSPTNHQYCTLLLDFFNNAIQYQYQGAKHLIYAIIRRGSIFFELGKVPTNINFNEIIANNKLGSSNSANLAAAAESVEEEPAAQTITQFTESSNNSTPNSSRRSSSSFVPTLEWLRGWKTMLPLDTIYRLLDFFQPKLHELNANYSPMGPAKLEGAIMELIESSTLVGIIPLPASIVVRRYIQNTYTNLWFSTYIFGQIFLRNQAPQIFDPSKIQLFQISSMIPWTDDD